MKKEFGILLLLIIVCGVTALKNPLFLSQANLTNLANSIGQYGVFSIGLGLVIITGGIDLSVGSMLALAGVLLSLSLREWHWPWPFAVLMVLLVPMILGWLHGWIITRLAIQPFIVTLCGLLIYRGVARAIADDRSVGFGPETDFPLLRFLTTGRLFRIVVEEPIESTSTAVHDQTATIATHTVEKFAGIPMPFVILLIVAFIAWIVLHRSVYGRYLLAVGKNEEAARFSGINTNRVITSSYVVAGLLTGISAIMFAMYTNQITPSIHGAFYEVYAIAAAVVGGCSLRGGEGSIIGILIGTALLQVLQNLNNLLSIPSALNWAVMGGVVLIGVIADQLLQRRAKNKLRQQST
jgi:ribose transport system permease protein